MLAAARLENIVLFVASLERSVRFYRETLGLPVELIDSHEGSLAIAQANPVSLVLIPRPARAGESPVLVFEIDGGIAGYAEKLAGFGVEIVVPVSEAPDGGLTFDFLDPDGNVLSLHQQAGLPA